jgi:hypothetical protein
MIIRKTNVTFAECDSFDEVCKFVNDLYRIVREQQKQIKLLVPPKNEPEKPQKKKK